MTLSVFDCGFQNGGWFSYTAALPIKVCISEIGIVVGFCVVPVEFFESPYD